MALSAFDIACWDACAKAAGLPLAKLLGSDRKTIPAYNSKGLSLKPPEGLADEAKSLLAEGFKAIKLRLGRDDPQARPGSRPSGAQRCPGRYGYHG
jgi:mandelate racemase